MTIFYDNHMLPRGSPPRENVPRRILERGSRLKTSVAATCPEIPEQLTVSTKGWAWVLEHEKISGNQGNPVTRRATWPMHDLPGLFARLIIRGNAFSKFSPNFRPRMLKQ